MPAYIRSSAWDKQKLGVNWFWFKKIPHFLTQDQHKLNQPDLKFRPDPELKPNLKLPNSSLDFDPVRLVQSGLGYV